MKKLVLFCALFFAAAGPACAGKVVVREISCPVCGRVFYAELDVPDSEYDMRLDLKPVGDVPAPWRLPDCPACGFIVYRLSMPKAELEKCRAVTASGDYKKNLKRSSYFRVGLLYEKLGESYYNTATSFLKASWQEETEPEKLKEDLELSLKYFSACALDAKTGLVESENSRLLMGELYRRLGRFGEARTHLSGLQGVKGFKNNFFGDMVEYELKLCAKKDASVYEMEDVRSSKRNLLRQLAWQYKKLIRSIRKRF